MLRITCLMTSIMISLISFGVLAGEVKPGLQTLDEVLALTSEKQSQSGEFRQVKSIAGLSRPLESSGQYFIDAKLGIVWFQVSPFEDLVVIKDDKLFSRVDNQLVAQEVPANVVSLITDIFASLMKGDIAKLKRQFQLEFSPQHNQVEGGWQVTLQPLSAPLNQVFETITLAGQEGELSQVKLTELSGDDTEIALMVNPVQALALESWLRGLK